MDKPKHSTTRRDGRSSLPEFANSFSKSLNVRVLISAAYRSLAPSAKDVCNIMFVKNDNAKYHKRKTGDGRPVFKFTKQEAVELLKISNKTFANALEQLDKHGLIERHKRGGLLGANGTASEFTLSSRWKEWNQAKRHLGRDNIMKARAAYYEDVGTHG